MQKLEELLQIQQQQEVEIGSAKRLAYKDPLTGVKNKRACEDYEEELDAKIKEGQIREFAVVSLDVNGLKMTNDTYGHKAGDELLISACRIICRHFSHSPVFRFGGDEFEVILQGQDYENRHAIAVSFNREAEQNLAEGVETESQLQLLKEAGCDIVQDFLFFRPLPVEEFEKKLAAQGSV